MAEERHFMNPQYGKHLMDGDGHHQEQEEHPAPGEHQSGHQFPQVHIHSHSKGHTVHVMHHDGRHEKHEHEHGDAEGMAQHLHEHFGQGHETSQSDEGDEYGI